MRTNREKLLTFIPMANYIRDMNGPRAESLIHDISDYDHSIIYITSGNITGRKVGGYLTDYAIQLIQNKIYEQTDYVVNYLGCYNSNNIFLRSSTYFIKENGQLIGLLCTNIDITEQIKATEMMKASLLVDLDQMNQKQAFENFSLSTEELIHKVFVKAAGVAGEKKLNITSKKKIVSELAFLDVFQVKGSITMVANLLNSSEKTIYRYIHEIKNGKESNN